MGKIQAYEFKNETSQLLQSISESLADFTHDTAGTALFYKHYLYWHEVKSLATLFSLHDITEISHGIESLFDLVTNGDIEFSQIPVECFEEALSYIEQSIDTRINNTSHSLDFDALLKKIRHTIPAAKTDKNQLSTQKTDNNGKKVALPLGEKCKILIVEDEPVNMTLLETNILNFNPDFEITSAETAEEGLFYFFTNHFDIIFLDIMMPVIDGNDFIAIVEKNIEKKNIATRCNIVVQTAIQSMEQLTSLAKKECVQEIIRKPISPKRIEECLTRYVIEPYQQGKGA